MKNTEILEGEEATRLQKKAKFVELRAKGLSYDKIAKRLKVSRSTVANWCQELEAEIARLRAIEMDALYEEFFLLKQGRIQLLGGQLKAIMEELKGRSLADVPTEKLLELQLRYYGALLAEYVELRPLSDAEVAKLQEAADEY